MGKPLNRAKPRKQRHRRFYVMVELHNMKALAERLKGLVAAGSADAKSLVADFPLLLGARRTP